MEKHLYVRMVLRNWKSSLEFSPGIEAPVEAKSVGFLEVYDSLEAFNAEHPGDDYTLIQFKENEKPDA